MMNIDITYQRAFLNLTTQSRTLLLFGGVLVTLETHLQHIGSRQANGRSVTTFGEYKILVLSKLPQESGFLKTEIPVTLQLHATFSCENSIRIFANGLREAVSVHLEKFA
jgi:hypothetical protein